MIFAEFRIECDTCGKRIALGEFQVSQGISRRSIEALRDKAPKWSHFRPRNTEGNQDWCPDCARKHHQTGQAARKAKGGA